MSAIEDLVAELAKLPGIGRKTAQRLTFHLLKQPAEAAERLAEAIRRVRGRVMACAVCGNLADDDPCPICRDPRRDPALLCVVEEPGDVEMLEDLVLAAVAEAQKRAAELYQAEVRKLASGLPFPFQLPL